MALSKGTFADGGGDLHAAPKQHGGDELTLRRRSVPHLAGAVLTGSELLAEVEGEGVRTVD
jgi:hypothetical protein